MIDAIIKELQTGSSAGAYASADDLLTIGDLPETDVIVKRWHRNGAPLRVRLKALSLDQQARIEQESMRLNPQTKYAERDAILFDCLTLSQSVIVPALNREQAMALRHKNPRVIRALVDYSWILSSLDEETLAALAADAAGVALDPDQPPTE